MQKESALGSHTEPEHDKPASILVYGRNAELLGTRRWVLKRAGMNVITTTKLAELESILVHEVIDLFILCHTLSPEEGDVCLMKAQALRPAMKKLVLTANTPLGFLGPGEAKVSAFDGPKMLISEVERLLGAPSNRPLLA